MHYDAETLDDYLHGEVEPALDATIHAHLESCTACTAAYDRTAALRDWVRAAARAEEREFPVAIVTRVRAEIRSAAPTPLDRLRAFWRPLVALPALAAVALIAYFGVPAFRATTGPSGVTATYLLEEHAAETSSNPLADHGLVVPAATAGTGQAPPGLLDAAAQPDTGSGSN